MKLLQPKRHVPGPGLAAECECSPEHVASPKPSPFVIEFFTVQGPNFRCTAYCDHAGKWRDAFTGEELFGAISIVA